MAVVAVAAAGDDCGGSAAEVRVATVATEAIAAPAVTTVTVNNSHGSKIGSSSDGSYRCKSDNTSNSESQQQ